MPTKITIKATQTHLEIEVPDLELKEEKRNLMAVDPSNNMVVGIGENQSEFEENFPEIWEKHKAAIQFRAHWHRICTFLSGKRGYSF